MNLTTVRSALAVAALMVTAMAMPAVAEAKRASAQP